MRAQLAPFTGRRAWPAVVVVGFAVAGALAGVLWWALWTPPTGVALEGRFVYDGPGSRAGFDATALFVVIALALGMLGGVAVGLVTRRDELVVLAALVVGSAGGTGLMYLVGHLLGPPDPATRAAGAEDLTPLTDHLVLDGVSPWVCLVAGALAGFLTAVLGYAPRRDETARTGPDALDWRGGTPGSTGGGWVGSARPAGEPGHEGVRTDHADAVGAADRRRRGEP